jgi:hypothetical protein
MLLLIAVDMERDSRFQPPVSISAAPQGGLWLPGQRPNLNECTFRHNVNHGSTASGNVAGVWRVRLSARRRGESLVVAAPS